MSSVLENLRTCKGHAGGRLGHETQIVEVRELSGEPKLTGNYLLTATSNPTDQFNFVIDRSSLLSSTLSRCSTFGK